MLAKLAAIMWVAFSLLSSRFRIVLIVITIGLSALPQYRVLESFTLSSLLFRWSTTLPWQTWNFDVIFWLLEVLSLRVLSLCSNRIFLSHASGLHLFVCIERIKEIFDRLAVSDLLSKIALSHRVCRLICYRWWVVALADILFLIWALWRWLLGCNQWLIVKNVALIIWDFLRGVIVLNGRVFTVNIIAIFYRCFIINDFAFIIFRLEQIWAFFGHLFFDLLLYFFFDGFFLHFFVFSSFVFFVFWFFNDDLIIFDFCC